MHQKKRAKLPLMGLAALGIMTAPAMADDLSVTIYSDGQAFVIDQRDLQFGQGETTINLPNVSSQIDARSVTFLADGIEIIEQNYDFDLLTPRALMEKSVGETVTLVSTNPGTGAETRRRARILAVNEGVVIEAGGRIEVLRDDGIPTRVIFDRVPPNLRAAPTLSILVDSETASTREAELRYLSRGLNWRADYVVIFDENAGRLDLQGWATIANLTETIFDDVALSLVANPVDEGRPTPRRSSSSVRGGGQEATPEATLGDFKIYPLEARTTLASNQTKQVSLVEGSDVPAARRYEFLSPSFQTAGQPINVDVRVAFSNSRDAGLNRALPAGTVRIYQRDEQGTALFAGEDRLPHTTGGSDISLKIGQAFDVTVQPRLVSRRTVNNRTTDNQMEYVVRNATNRTVEVIVDQQLGTWWRAVTVEEESLPSTEPMAGMKRWVVEVPPEGETTLSATIRTVSRR